MNEKDVMDLDDLLNENSDDLTMDIDSDNQLEDKNLETIDDLLTADSSNKKSKNKEKKQKNKKTKEKSGGYKFKYFVLGTFLPVLIIGIAAFIGGILISDTPATSGSANQNSQVIDSISKGVSIVDRVSDVKDSQLLALNSKISNVLNENNSAPANDQLKIINDQISSATTSSIDSLMMDVLNDNTTKTRDERIVALKKHFDIPEDESTMSDINKQILENLNTFVDGDNLSNQLKLETAKAGIPFVSILAFLSDNSAIYQVIVPTVTSDSKVYNTLYIVRLSSTNKVMAMSYEGYLLGIESDGLNYFNSLNNIITNEMNKMKENINSTNETADNLPQNTKDTTIETTVENVEATETSTTDASTTDAQ